MTNNFYIFTGGPGVGKTSLINALSWQGFQTVSEDARQIIREQMASNGNALPWANKQCYAQLMLDAALENYAIQKSQTNGKPVFFDRGIPDSICYMKMENISIDEKILNAVKNHPYNKNVFIFPPWKEIYTTDSERKQNWDEVLFTHQQMMATYQELGYTVFEMPETSVAERLDFILNILRLKKL